MGVNQRENLFVAVFKSMRKKVRMSMGLRIAANFLKLTIIGGIVFFIIFMVSFMVFSKTPYAHLAEATLLRLENKLITVHETEEILATENIYFRLTDLDDKIIFSNVQHKRNRIFDFWDGFYIDSSQGTSNVYYEESMDMMYDGKPYKAKFSYTLTTEYYQMLKMMGILVFAYLIIVVLVMKKSRDDSEKMLKPIDNMTATISNLTINNLESERLKVYEMNTELQELAEVFNAMLDRLEESYESQKIFVSNASHELRTPIAVIQGYAGMLDRWGAEDEAILRESIDAILHESSDMKELVEKLLFLSRHDKKTLKIEKDIFNMKPVVEDMMKETQMIVSDRKFEMPVLEDVSIMADKQSLKQLLRIFVDNAIKYTEEGDTIRVSCHNSRGNLTLIIEDTGIGMSKEDMGKIFERFFRSDEVRGRNISGHGLGLSIAKLIVASHDGNIHVSSKLGKGTTFIVSIPRGFKS